MRVDPNSRTTELTGFRHLAAKAQKPRSGEDKVEFSVAEKLDRSLEAVPQVRAEKVEQARALVMDKSYPSKETLGRVARVLAEGFRGEE
ncbi:MAG TPA: hypothetical protein VEC99_05175 [Clostridia bacterium]|nr:hypothetical protein [Clostridia bacterium]